MNRRFPTIEELRKTSADVNEQRKSEMRVRTEQWVEKALDNLPEKLRNAANKGAYTLVLNRGLTADVDLYFARQFIRERWPGLKDFEIVYTTNNELAISWIPEER